jgi:hypothetical protein
MFAKPGGIGLSVFECRAAGQNHATTIEINYPRKARRTGAHFHT